MSTGFVTVTIDPGTPELGVWCDDCQLSTATRFPLTMTSIYGVTSLRPITICERCERLS